MEPGDPVRVDVPIKTRAGHAVGGLLMLATAMVPASLLIFSGVAALGVIVFLVVCTLLPLWLVWGYVWGALGVPKITADAGRVLVTNRVLGVPGRTVYEQVSRVYLIDAEQRVPRGAPKVVTWLVIRSKRKPRFLRSQTDCGNLEAVYALISERAGARSFDMRGRRVFQPHC